MPKITDIDRTGLDWKHFSGRIKATTHKKLKIQLVKDGLTQEEVLQILADNYVKNGLPE